MPGGRTRVGMKGWDHYMSMLRPPHRTTGGPLHGLRVALHPLDLLLLAAPLAFAAERWHWSAALLFFASGLAIIPLARLIGVATEELAGRLGSAAGGLLNATFGNATEL